MFTSTHEKKLWLWALVVLVLIFSTLFIGRPLAELFSNQNIQAAIILPNRVFDPNDIIFNGFAMAIAIGSNVAFNWGRRQLGKKSNE